MDLRPRTVRAGLSRLGTTLRDRRDPHRDLRVQPGPGIGSWQQLKTELHARTRLATAKARKLFRLASNRAYWPALKKGVAASVEHSKIPFGEQFATVLDVGASRGQFALFSIENFPEAEIVSFEPQPGPASDLRDLLGDRITVVESALGPEAGKAEMNISGRDDSSSLLAIGERQQQEFPGTGTDHTIEVPISTLDAETSKPLARPVLLKMDVQGFELDALRGGPETLEEVDVALIECSFVELYEGQALAGEVVNFMTGAGFHLDGVYEVAYSADGSAIQGDFLFRRA